MAHVDALSHIVPPSQSSDCLSTNAELAEQLEIFVALTATEKVHFMQYATKNLIKLLTDTGSLVDHEAHTTKHYKVHDGVLYRKYDGRLLLVVPKIMRKGIVIGAHDCGGHFALDHTVAKITEDY